MTITLVVKQPLLARDVGLLVYGHPVVLTWSARPATDCDPKAQHADPSRLGARAQRARGHHRVQVPGAAVASRREVHCGLPHGRGAQRRRGAKTRVAGVVRAGTGGRAPAAHARGVRHRANRRAGERDRRTEQLHRERANVERATNDTASRELPTTSPDPRRDSRNAAC